MNFVASHGRLASLVVAWAMLAFAPLARAAVSIPHGSVELVAEQESIQPGHSVTLGLHFQLEQGWHIYWINPGDSGEPPRLDWHLPAGWQAGAIEWPAPERLPIASLLDYGYEREVLLPVSVEAAADLASGGDAALAGNLRAIICRDVCIPVKAHLTLSLPVRAEKPQQSKYAVMFRTAREAMPKHSPASWRPSARDLGDSFELTVRTARAASGAWFAPLEPLQIENAAPQKSVSTAAGVRLILKKSDQLSSPIAHLRGVLVLRQGAYTIDATVTPAEGKKPHKEQ